MQGVKACESKLFYQVTLETLVPADHLVRRLARVVDLGWIRAATARQYSHTGKPSIDPVVVAKMLILGFFYNIPSERQLMREIQVNLAYRWYLGYDLDEDIPNHSVLSKARRRLGPEFFEKLFGFVLQLCQKSGLIEGRSVLVDSTLVKGNAASESLTTLKYSPGEYLQELEAHDSLPPTEVELVASKELGCNRPGENRIRDQKHSLTDPEATLTSKGKVTVLGHKTHIAADAGQGVITAVTVTTAAADDTWAVPQLLEKHQEALDAKPQRVVADSAYGSQDCLAYLQEQEITTVIKKRGGGNRNGGYDKSEFKYREDQDVYFCPAGARLGRVRTDKVKRKAHYRCDPQCCLACAQRRACLGAKSTAKARTVTRFDTPYESRAQAACASSSGRKLLKLRHTLLEGLFGQAKNFHGLRTARWRGLGNMLIQSLLIATVLNMKKLLTCVCQARAAAVAACAHLFLVLFCFFSGRYSLNGKIMPIKIRSVSVNRL